MKESKEIQTIIVNNKISNVCPGGLGDRGYSDSDTICAEVASALSLKSIKNPAINPKTLVFPSSTGIIGWRLPVPSIVQAIPQLLQTKQR